LAKYRYVIVACARWETPYIGEWIAYYKAIGFSHIYLYCNDDDATGLRTEVFAESSNHDFVTFRHFLGQGQQSLMYHDAMNTVRAEADWVTFLDIDEFLVLRNVDDVHAFMAPFENSTDSVYFNWLMFGNNGFLVRPPGSVLNQYTRRSASLDPHTKHLSRVRKLIPEKMAMPFFPFWHGLADPLWSDVRRVNVLGDDWGHYLDDFPKRATDILDDPVLVQKITSTAVVNHYGLKSEADFTLRAQRGLEGNFGGQIKWAEIVRNGEHKRVLRELDATEDTYMRDFANDRDLTPSQRFDSGVRSPLAVQQPVRRVLARNASWQAELELDASTARVMHCTNGSTGNYKECQGLLVVEWDHWPLEIFSDVDGIHQSIFAAKPSFNQPEFLRNLDVEVFAIASQTSASDRKSLLILQNIVRNLVPSYVYFEIGSHLGGTLVPHLIDPLCKHVFSVDKRPASQPDERGMMFDYEGNSTQRMLSGLEAHLPASALLKLTTYDSDVADLAATQIPLKVDFAFIDAEHTNVAVFRDFICTKEFLTDSFVVGFHDSNLIFDGIQNIECLLRHLGVKFKSMFLPDAVYAIVSGDFVDIASQQLERFALDREAFIHHSRRALWKHIASIAG
jgi:hypothetical protein